MYKDIVLSVDLSGPDGNGWGIVERVSVLLAENGVAVDAVEKYRALAFSGSYENLLAVTGEWVTLIIIK